MKRTAGGMTIRGADRKVVEMTGFKGHCASPGLLAFTLILIFPFLAFGQTTDIRPLSPKQITEREMSGKESHLYKIELKQGEFFQVRVEQKGVDVALKLLDADGNILTAMDSPNGMEGPETLSFVASKDGIYRLDVSGFDEKAGKGFYTIKREASRMATSRDHRRVEVEKLFGEGMTARNTEGPSDTTIKRLEDALAGWRELNDVYLSDLTARQLKTSKAEKKLSAVEEYQSSGNYDKAIEILNEALTVFKELQDKPWIAAIYGGLGIMYESKGNYGEAIEYQKNALRTVQDIQQKETEAIIHKRIGLLYKRLGEKGREEALSHFRNALQIYTELDDKNGQANVLNSIGKATHPFEDGLVYFKQSLELYREEGDKAGEAAVLGNMSFVYQLQSDWKNMLETVERSLKINREMNDLTGEASNLLRIALVLERGSRVSNAIEFAQKSLRLFESSKDIEGKQVAFMYLMRLYKRLGNSEMALFYGIQLINNHQETRFQIKNLDEALRNSFLFSVEDNYRYVADLFVEQGRFAQAERVLRMLKDEEYLEFVRRDAEEILKLDERIPLDEKEQELVKKYSILVERIAGMSQEFIKLDNKKRRLSRNDLTLSSEEQKRYKELEEQIDTANAAFQLFLTKGLAEELGRQTKTEIELDRNLQSKLRKWGEGTVAIYTVAGKDRYRVFLTTPKVQIAGKTEIKAADLNRKVFAFRSALQNPAVDPRPLGKELYDILLKPIEKDLTASGAKTLIWSLDGVLRYIPLAALSPDGVRYLVEDFQNVIITPKTRDDVSGSDSNWQALGLGVSTGQTVESPDDRGKKIAFGGLPGTERELMAIVRDEEAGNESGVLLGRRFLNEGFTITALKDSLAKEDEAGKRKYNIVHIASHFRLGSNWSNSFLLLGNGQVLTLEEINNSSTIDFGDVELVTLSACNTGFGDVGNGKEIDSLASVIQTKSGKSVLATLWAVADESTSLLMSEFYRLKQESPALTKAGAIQIVQQAMIRGGSQKFAQQASNRSDLINLGDETTDQPPYKKDPNALYAHPYYWSPFVLYGNWK